MSGFAPPVQHNSGNSILLLMVNNLPQTQTFNSNEECHSSCLCPHYHRDMPTTQPRTSSHLPNLGLSDLFIQEIGTETTPGKSMVPPQVVQLSSLVTQLGVHGPEKTMKTTHKRKERPSIYHPGNFQGFQDILAIHGYCESTLLFG